jgi:hypothetical protein
MKLLGDGEMIKDDAPLEFVPPAIGEDHFVIEVGPATATQPVLRDPMHYRVVREMLLQLATESPPPFQLQWPIPVELDVEWVDDDSTE